MDYDPCTSKTKSSGKRCKNKPIPGGTVCWKHGGNAPQVRAKAAARLQVQKIEARAAATLAHHGLNPVEDPLRELGKLAASSQALQEALGARVNSLRDLEQFDSKNSPYIRAEVLLYERAMDRTGRLLDALVKHGYTERQIAISEQEALLVSGVIRRVLAALGLTAEQQRQAQTLLAEEFRELEARSAQEVI